MKRFISILMILVVVIMIYPVAALPVNAASEVTYKITTKVCDGYQNGTNSKVNFTIYGTEQNYTINNLGGKISGNAFKRNATDTYQFKTQDLGQIYGLNIACGADGVKFEYIKIEKRISGDNWNLVARFNIGDWVDNTNKTFYTNRENIYRIKVVTADNPFDGTEETFSMSVFDTNGKSFTIANLSAEFLNQKFLSGKELSAVILASTTISDVKYITLKNTSGTDAWKPAYIQIERMSTSTTANNIIWGSETLFVPNESIGAQEVKIERYNQTVLSDKATGLASIFFEPNFYIITGIVIMLIVLGIAVYYKKKNINGKENAK